jgi:hypothetical protein
MQKRLSFFLSATFFINLIIVKIAMAEGEPWQYISNINFSKDGIGFVLRKGDEATDHGTITYYEKKILPF